MRSGAKWLITRWHPTAVLSHRLLFFWGGFTARRRRSRNVWAGESVKVGRMTRSQSIWHSCVHKVPLKLEPAHFQVKTNAVAFLEANQWELLQAQRIKKILLGFNSPVRRPKAQKKCERCKKTQILVILARGNTFRVSRSLVPCCIPKRESRLIYAPLSHQKLFWIDSTRCVSFDGCRAA